MSDLKHLFVPYELNIALINKGCNLPCLATFDWNKKIKIFGGTKKTTECVKAYTYQQVVDWFREKHGIVPVAKICSDKSYLNDVVKNNHKDESVVLHLQAECSKTYYEALNKAIEEALKLI